VTRGSEHPEALTLTPLRVELRAGPSDE
jgi:hypothetical protein